MIKFTMDFKQLTVTKAHTILVYLPDHFYVGTFVHLYIYCKCLFKDYMWD